MATILVVDDHPDSRDLLVTLLGYRGHTVLEAGHGAKALEVAAAHRLDLVITDLVMPVMDGYELVRELRAGGHLVTAKVIFYTAHYLHDEVLQMAAALSVDHIVSKPVDPELLLAAVDEVLAAAPAIPEAVSPDQAQRDQLRSVSAKLSDKVRELETVEELLKASEARFRSLTESSRIGVFSLDRVGQLTYTNPRLPIAGLATGFD
jgi:CheY-like chemotaxis protein